MTKKDYFLMVRVLKHLPKLYGSYVPYDALVGAMAKEFEQDNEGFNRTKFVTACYPDTRLDRVVK